jgi:hypothetical protein
MRDYVGPLHSEPVNYDAFRAPAAVPRTRNPAKLWTAAAVAGAFVMLSTLAAVSYFGVPDHRRSRRGRAGARRPGAGTHP